MKKMIMVAVMFLGVCGTSFANGLDQLPTDEQGNMYYGEGSYKGGFNYLGHGRVKILCSGKFFSKDSDWRKQWTGFVGKKKSGHVTMLKYSVEAGSESCAKAKAIVACATENYLDYCEAYVDSLNF